MFIRFRELVALVAGMSQAARLIAVGVTICLNNYMSGAFCLYICMIVCDVCS